MAISKSELQYLFGQHIKQIRIDKGFTLLRVSQLLNKDPKSIRRIESGNVCPNLFFLNNLAVVLNISLSELLSFEVKEFTLSAKTNQPFKKK